MLSPRCVVIVSMALLTVFIVFEDFVLDKILRLIV